jgi:outer membrane protein assembly factor BamB
MRWQITVVSLALLSSQLLITQTSAQTSGSHSPASPSRGWPGWGGPNRDFTSDATGLADAWPESGPPKLWQRALGEGHSGIAVDQNRLFTLYRPATGAKGSYTAREVIVALDAATGKTLWEHEYPASLDTMDFNYGAGPHSTPMVVGGRVFAVGTNKQFFALDAASGKVLWAHNFVSDFQSPANIVRYPVKPGYAASPLAYKDMIIAMVGGPGQGVIAFRQDDGRVVWRAGTYSDIAQASPQIINVGGQEQLVVVSNDGVHGLDPANGQPLWGPVPLEKQYGAHMSTPLWSAQDSQLLFSAGYDGGAKALQLTRTGGTTTVSELWFSNKLRVHFGNVVRIGDLYVGSSGDFGPSFLTAVHAGSGAVAWQNRAFSKAQMIPVDGKVLLLDEDGTLGLIKVAPDKASVLAKAPVTAATSWTAPTLVGTTLYVRDRANIMAFNLARP